MKKMILSICTMLWLSFCDAQNKKDTIMVDSTQVERINRMPMDSTHEKMLSDPSYPKDTVLRKTGDDEDPKIPKSPK